MTHIRLLLADDHPVVRAGLRALLESEADFVVVHEVATAEAAIERARAGDIDVVLMDLQFGPGLGGSAATHHITTRPGAPRVIVLTTYGDWAFLTVGLPATRDWTQTGFPRSTCVRHERSGRPLYPGNDGAHPTACRSAVGICRIPAARP